METLQVFIDGELKQNITTFSKQIKEIYDNWIRIINQEGERSVDVTIIWKKNSEADVIKQVFPKTM